MYKRVDNIYEHYILYNVMVNLQTKIWKVGLIQIFVKYKNDLCILQIFYSICSFTKKFYM